MYNVILSSHFEILTDINQSYKELEPTSKCFKDYTISLKKTGNCQPATVNGYQQRKEEYHERGIAQGCRTI